LKVADRPFLVDSLSNLTDSLYRYRVSVNDDCGQAVVADYFTVRTYKSFEGGSISVEGTSQKSSTLCFGESTTLRFETPPSGGRVGSGDASDYTYQWYEKAPGQSTYSALLGVANETDSLQLTNTFSISPGVYFYQLTVRDTCSEDTVGNIRVTYYDALSAPQIDLVDYFFCPDSLPSDSIEVLSSATGGDSIYQYWWERSSDKINWNTIEVSGSVAQNLVFSSSNSQALDFALDTVFYYRLRSYNPRCGDTLSSNIDSLEIFSRLTSTAVLGVSSVSFPSGIQDSLWVCYGEGIDSLWTTAQEGDGNYHYQWELSVNGSAYVDLKVADRPFLVDSLSNLTDSLYRYRVLVTDGCHQRDTTEIFEVRVHKALKSPSITTSRQTDTLTLCFGDTVILIIDQKPSGGQAGQNVNLEYTYTWEVDATNGSSGFQALSNDSILPLNSAQNPGVYRYRLKVSDTCRERYSDTIEVRIKPLPSSEFNYIYGDDKLCLNQQNISYSLTEEYDSSYTYHWWYGTDSVSILNVPTTAFFPVSPLRSDTLKVFIRDKNWNQPVCERVIKKYIHFDSTYTAMDQSFIVKKRDLPLLACSLDSTRGVDNKKVLYQWGRIDRWYWSFIIDSDWNRDRYHIYDSIDTSRFLYFVRKALDTNACLSYSYWPSFNESRAIGLEDSDSGNDYFTIYPNPSSRYFNLKGPLKKIKLLEVYNFHGQIVNHWFDNGIVRFDQLAPGYYFLRLHTSTREVQTLTFIITP
jgi:hypothetical protein